MIKRQRTHFVIYSLPTWLLVIACFAGMLTACSQDVCYDNFYVDSHSEQESSGAYERRQCTSHRQVSKASSSYVIEQKRLYFLQSQSSTFGTCVGNIGSYSSAGRSFCPFGTTSYSITTNSFFPLEFEPNPGAFRALAENYGVANDKVYNKQFVIPGARPLPAEVPLRILPLSANREEGRHIDSNYAVYGDWVFFGSQLVEGADATSFQALLFDDPDKDRNRYYFSDAARDKTRVYWEGRMLDDSDPESFEVVDYHFLKDRHHLWYQMSGDIGMVVDKLPEDLGGGFFRSHFTSPQGVPYSRIQRSEKLDDGRSVLRTLPLRMSEGDEFTVLSAGCPPGSRTMNGHPGVYCAPFKYQVATEFGRTKNKVFLLGEQIPGVDVASFQLFSVEHYDHGGFAVAQAIDALNLYLFRDDWHHSVALQGPATGPIPDRYGRFLLVADTADIYDLTGWYPDLHAKDWCRYGGPSATRGLKMISRDEGRDGRPYIVLENDHYRYVFYSVPKGKNNPGYVVDLRTGQRLRMSGDDEQPCGPDGTGGAMSATRTKP